MVCPRSQIEENLSSLKANFSDQQNAWNVARVEMSKERDMLGQQLSTETAQVSTLKLEMSQVGTSAI